MTAVSTDATEGVEETTTTPDEPAAPEQAQNDEQVLDLRSLAPTRRLVRLNAPEHPEGVVFEIRQMEDFGIEKQHQLMAWGRRYQRLMNSGDDVDEISPKDSTRLRFLLDSIFDAVLSPAPGMTEARFSTVKDDLPDSERMKVVQAFTAGPLLERQEAQMAVVRRLVDRDLVSQEQVDAILAEIRYEVAQAQDQLMLGN